MELKLARTGGWVFRINAKDVGVVKCVIFIGGYLRIIARLLETIFVNHNVRLVPNETIHTYWQGHKREKKACSSP